MRAFRVLPRNLPQRRITAILKEATLVGRGDYDHATYKARLDYVTGKLAAMKVPSTLIYAKEAAIRHFEKVAKLMEFAKKEMTARNSRPTSSSLSWAKPASRSSAQSPRLTLTPSAKP